MKPIYNIDEFIADCADTNKVHVRYEVVETASVDFGLADEKCILSFIANNGLEKLCFFNAELWDKNPFPSIPTMVDAYDFYSGFKFGYLAFLKHPSKKAKKWLLKSFKKNTNPGTASFPFKDLEKMINLKKLKE